MFRIPASAETVADALKRRGVRAVAYFHTDHFEPWRPVPGRAGGMETGVGDIERYLGVTAGLDFARKATLFFKPNVGYTLSTERELRRAHPEDLLGFLPRGEAERQIAQAMTAPIASGSDHEIQVHIHHEYFTYNGRGPGFEAYEYLQTAHGRSFDADRLDLAVRLTLDTLREDAGIPLSRWFFVHGNWALNASDPKDCTIVREIEILRRNGCLGDFTQPAGRLHVDSRIDVPFLVDPVAAPKGYDTPQANPVEAQGSGAEAAAKRFFIWASAVTHASCSIDTFSSAVQRRMKTPRATALEHAKRGVVVDGVLFVKTHAHSLHPSYWVAEGARPIPHTDPGVRAELAALFDAADSIGANVKFLTASEVYDEIVGAPAPERRDLVRDYRLTAGVEMDGVGFTIEYQGLDGTLADPPPLKPRSLDVPEPTVAKMRGEDAGAVEPRDELLSVAHIVPLPLSNGSQGNMDSAEPNGPLIDAVATLRKCMASSDVRMINEVARSLALSRSAALGTEASGVTGYYGTRAEQGTLLQPSEVVCAEFLETRLSGVRGVYEIGCGLGLLTTLLAIRGLGAVGLERNGARLETAKAIANAVVSQASHGASGPRWVKGVFPKALRSGAALTNKVALVTNLLGSATAAQQEAFVDGLRAFGAVIIDAQRFYERRVTRDQFAQLFGWFASRGFDPPQLAFDLGSDGRFILFTNPRPRRRLGLAAALAALGLGSKGYVALKPGP